MTALPSMAVLLAQDTLDFRPVAGRFDVEAVEAEVMRLGFTFRDEADPSRFVVSSDAESRDVFQARRRAEPDGAYPFTLLVAVTPEEVTVAPVGDYPPLRALSEQFVTWLAGAYECRIINDDGVDVRTLPEPAASA